MTFDPRELRLIEALRALRMLHYSAWIASRWDDPIFPDAFPWFNTVRYWGEQILAAAGTAGGSGGASAGVGIKGTE